ncbi:MAG TPA: TetR/AcrR family transcriptional regulator [Burkholderiaceae bacterium]|jgi:AcrR family transcriptional regulator|nr:TetR/AcrR family transcriptional regulator [Burkholderiaceae bacterium]
MQRKSAILLAANAHFAHFGFRGASLRDIAREAQVSLTLLNHHFGSKFQLLLAVIDAHQDVLDERAAALRTLVDDPGGFSVHDIVSSWVRLGFATAGQPDGEMFLRLVARVIDDPEEEAVQVVREKLDDGALLFIDALLRCHPDASRYQAACAYQCFNAALLKFLIGSRRVLRLARAELSDDPVVALRASSSVADDPAQSPSVDNSMQNATADPVRHEAALLDNAGPTIAPGDSTDAVSAQAASPNPVRAEDQERLIRFVVAGIEALMRG